MLKVENLSFDYRGKPILADLSFELFPESITALLGPNGSGKTTLLRCLDLFLKPKKGNILLNNRPIKTFSPNAIARRIAYMPQRCAVTALTVFDSLLLGRKPYLSWKPSPKDFELVEKTLKRLDLLDKSLRPLNQLSGGELQKVTLGRVFVQEPQLVLLDEPTSSLDLKNQMEIMRHLTHFARHNRAAVLMSVHDLNEAFQAADRLLFLKNGRLLADETPEAVTEKTLADVFDLQLEIHNHANKKLVVPSEQKRS